MKMIMVRSVFVSTIILFFFVGCASHQPMYYWGDYSNSLYKCHKDPDEKNIAKHQVLLENLIKESESRNLRTPPGVCGELGYIYMLKDNKKEAIRLFTLEKETYPESGVFMDNLIQQVEKRTKDEETIDDSIENRK